MHCSAANFRTSTIFCATYCGGLPQVWLSAAIAYGTLRDRSWLS
ncbi:MAG: hypothetical protein V7L14_05700 [Nostoc sp.]